MPAFYWRLSGFYFFYFASLGALIPFWALYLKHLGFAPRAIGELMAVIMATKIISPNVWGWIADRTGRRMAIVRMGTLLAVVCFAGIYLGHAYWWIVVVMAAFSFFWNAALPQFEATTFTHLGERTHQYSAIRLWGSVGFILTAGMLGTVLERYGPDLLPGVVLVLFAGIWVMSLAVPERAAGHLHLDHEPLARVLRRPEVLALIVVVFLMQAGHGPYYTFYTIYMEDHGYTRTVIGGLWALGVVAEVGVFLVMHRLVPRFGLWRMLLFSLAAAVLRWLMVGFLVDSFPAMVAAQLLHAATFGVYHAAAIQFVHRFFTGRHQGRGQALYSSMSFGAGGAFGSLVSGYTWDSLGTTTTYVLASTVSAAAFVLAWRYIPRE